MRYLDHEKRKYMTGIVKWFNNTKGYGFVVIEDKEALVHYTQILTDGYKTLSQNEIVKVGNLIKTQKGLQAQAVKKIQL